jgi:hypothetical protein
MNEAFKVVRSLDGRLFSAVVSGLADPLQGPYVTEYKPNEFVRAKVGRLFCFLCLVDARKWSCFHNNIQLWRCEPEGLAMADSALCLDSFSQMKEFWSGRVDRQFITYDLPYGSATASALKLTQKVC